ncbi:MAG: DUF881 domain-containing protein [Actinobacteria bacterium]|nr:DUF881 domain-containing protein [Actinomycetota bacterium]
MNKLPDFHFNLEQIKRIQLIIAFICGIIGLLIATQLKVQQNVTVQLSAQSEQDLGQIVRELTNEINTLQRDVSNYTIQLYKYNQAASDKKTILNEAVKNLQTLKISAGLINVQGPGIIIQLEDKKNVLNNYDLFDLVQELKSAGAEAISINDKQITSRTAFKMSGNRIVIDNKKISPPYYIRSIGNPDTLYQAINLLGGIRDALTSFEGVSLKIKKENNLVVPAVEKQVKYKFAKPVNGE